MLYSGKAMYKLLKTPKNKQIKLITDPSKDHYSSDEKLPFWDGTVIGIDLCLDNSLDFEQLLTSIRRVYGEGKKEIIKQRNKQKYRKPRFI
jgi:hypothetical protein